MTKATQTQVKLTPEEEAFLAEEMIKDAAKKPAMPMMTQLLINGDRVNDKGEKIEPDTWNIRGESVYVDTIDFQPLRYVSKFIRMVQEDKKWKNENESIFFNGWEPAYDALGTVGCGRIIGRLPATWSEAQKQANYKQATQYGFLFGLAKFPGKDPVLVNFRASPSKDRQIRETVVQNLPLNSDGTAKKMYQVSLKMKLSPPAKGEKFTAMDLTVVDRNGSFLELLPYIKEVDAYIKSHNDRIMERRKQFAERVSGRAVYKEVGSLADDFNMDTDIPFGE